MKNIVLFFVLAALFLQVRAEDLESTGSANAFVAATWIGTGRAALLTCTEGSAVVSGTVLDSLVHGDLLYTAADVFIGIVSGTPTAGSLVLASQAAMTYTGGYKFNRLPRMTDNISILSGHTVDALTASGPTAITVQNLVINGTFITDLTGLNIAADLTVNAGGVFTQNSGGVLIMNGAGASIGGTANSITIRNLRVTTSLASPAASVTLKRPVVILEELNIENAEINLNGTMLTIGTSAGAAGSYNPEGTYQNVNAPGAITRWFPGTTLFTIPSLMNVFPFTDGGANRNLWIGGTTDAGGSGTLTVTFDATPGTTSISFTEVGIFDKRTNMNWTVSHAEGFSGTGLSLRIQASGLQGIAAVEDLNLSSMLNAASGTFAASTNTASDPYLNRTFAGTADLDGTYYIASTAGSAMPVELTTITARAIGRTVVLQWNTASETNNFGFEIERRVIDAGAAAQDGVWTTIGFTEGHGSVNTPRSYTFTDFNAGAACAYRLKQIDRDGRVEYSREVTAGESKPSESALTQNFPNPFNPATNFQFTLPFTQRAVLIVYNALGQEVRTLFDGVAEGAHVQSVAFDASGLPSGMYFYVLRSNGKTEVRKMQLLR